MIAAKVLVALLIAPTATLAAQCNSINGQINPKMPTIARKVILSGSTLILSGTMSGAKLPTRKLPCVPLFEGVLCEAHFGSAVVTVMTNRNMMTETVVETSGRESGIAYACDQAIKMKR